MSRDQENSPEPNGKRALDPKTAPARKRRKWRWLIWTAAGLAVLLIAGRIALPYAVKDYVNRLLNRSDDYSGHIADVHMKLWKGGYRIDQPAICKRNGRVQTPLFSASEVDFTVDWRELFHGSLVGEVDAENPRINFVTGPTEDQKQTGKGQRWDQTLEQLSPFRLNRVQVDNGEIHYQDPHGKPPADLYLSKLYATATNLTNSRKLGGKLPAGLSVSGTTLGGGRLEVELHMDPFRAGPTYEVNGSLTNVDVAALNDYLRDSAGLDVKRGEFQLFTSVASDNGNYTGYIKILLQNLKVFQWPEEKKKSPLKIAWQAVAGAAAGVLENHPKDQVAMKIPVSGNSSNNVIGVWRAIGTVFANRFVRALSPGLDEKETLEQADRKNPDKGKSEPASSGTKGPESSE